MINLGNFSLLKVQKFKGSKCVKKAVFALLESQKLISRKIRVTVKSCNFHTVVEDIKSGMHLQIEVIQLKVEWLTDDGISY